MWPQDLADSKGYSRTVEQGSEEAERLEARLAELQKRRGELAMAYSDNIGGNETVWLLHRVTRELEAVRAKLRRLAN